MRLIDADAYQFPGDLVNEPTVDAVPVVRCKDCKWFTIENDDFCGNCTCEYFIHEKLYPERHHFCYYGERKEQ